MFSNRDSKTLLDNLVALLFSITCVWNRPVVLVADACYASGKVITPLLDNGHHLITRAKTNAVAYLAVPQVEGCSRGRPKTCGQKVRLKDLGLDDCAFTSAPSPVYVENDMVVRYRALDVLCKPVGRVVRFCIVHDPVRGSSQMRCAATCRYF